MSLRVTIGWRHHLIGVDPVRGDAGPGRELLRRTRPNACEAEALFRSDWTGRRIAAADEGELALVIMLEHALPMPADMRLARTGGGWAARVRIPRARLQEPDGSERSIRTIHEALEAAMQEILVRIGRQRLRSAGI